MNLGKYTKAIGAAVTAAFLTYQVAGSDSSASGEAITGTEWRNIVVALVVTGILTWAVPNDPPNTPA